MWFKLATIVVGIGAVIASVYVPGAKDMLQGVGLFLFGTVVKHPADWNKNEEE